MAPRSSRRRRFQFSLRTLLIFVTLLTLPLAWLSWKINQTRNEQAVIIWVEKWGGSVELDSWIVGSVRMVDLNNTKVRDLSPLAELSNLKNLQLMNTPVTDLTPLESLQSLEALYIQGTPANAASLDKHLPHCLIMPLNRPSIWLD